MSRCLSIAPRLDRSKFTSSINRIVVSKKSGILLDDMLIIHHERGLTLQLQLPSGQEQEVQLHEVHPLMLIDVLLDSEERLESYLFDL